MPSTRRRSSLALLTVALLSGCTGGPPADDPPAEAVATILQKVDEQGLYEVSEIVGLAADGDGRWIWDPLEGMLADTFRVLLVQVRSDTSLNLTEDRDVVLAAESLTGEQQAAEACVAHQLLAPAPGEFFLARSQGQPSSYEAMGGLTGEDRDGTTAAGGSGFSGPGTAMRSAVQGSDEVDLEADAWVFLATGLTGFPPEQAAADGHWTYTFTTDAALRFVELRPAGFLCGSGFGRLGGQDVPSPVNAHVGGEGGIEALYGGRFTFCAPALDARNGLAVNSADATFLQNETHLALAGYHEDNSTGSGPIRLAVQQWVGSPTWTMEGVWLPPQWGFPDFTSQFRRGFCLFTP